MPQTNKKTLNSKFFPKIKICDLTTEETLEKIANYEVNLNCKTQAKKDFIVQQKPDNDNNSSALSVQLVKLTCA